MTCEGKLADEKVRKTHHVILAPVVRTNLYDSDAFYDLEKLQIPFSFFRI